MTIKEIREKRQELNEQIADLIWEFAQTTNVQPKSIKLEPSCYYTDEGAYDLSYFNVMVSLEEI